MQKWFWWWQCSDWYIIYPPPQPPTHTPPYSPCLFVCCCVFSCCFCLFGVLFYFGVVHLVLLLFWFVWVFGLFVWRCGPSIWTYVITFCPAVCQHIWVGVPENASERIFSFSWSGVYNGNAAMIWTVQQRCGYGTMGLNQITLILCASAGEERGGEKTALKSEEDCFFFLLSSVWWKDRRGGCYCNFGFNFSILEAICFAGVMVPACRCVYLSLSLHRQTAVGI